MDEHSTQKIDVQYFKSPQPKFVHFMPRRLLFIAAKDQALQRVQGNKSFTKSEASPYNLQQLNLKCSTHVIASYFEVKLFTPVGLGGSGVT